MGRWGGALPPLSASDSPCLPAPRPAVWARSPAVGGEDWWALLHARATVLKGAHGLAHSLLGWGPARPAGGPLASCEGGALRSPTTV